MSLSSLLAYSELQIPPIHFQSAGAVDFITAIAGGGFENQILTTDVVVARKVLIWDVTISSVDNLDWSLWFWSDILLETSGLLSGRVDFVAADGRQLGGAGPFFYSLRNTTADHPFPFAWTLENTETTAGIWTPGFPVSLVNNSVGAKTAGANTFLLNIIYMPVGNV